MSKIQYFNWSDYDNDIHIGSQKTYRDYQYRNNESRSDYFKRWYEKNREKHIAKVRAGQRSEARRSSVGAEAKYYK